MDIVEFVGHYANLEFHVSMVDWDRYQVMELYDDFQKKGSRIQPKIPKYFLLYYTLPGKPNSRKPLDSDGDYAKMREDWENVTMPKVDLYLKVLPKPSKPQVILESVIKLQLQKPQLEQCNSSVCRESSPIHLGFDLGEDDPQPVTTPSKPQHVMSQLNDRFDSGSASRVLGLKKDAFGLVQWVASVEEDEISMTQAKKWADELILTQEDGSTQTLFTKSVAKKLSPQKAKKLSPKKAKIKSPQKSKKPIALSQPLPTSSKKAIAVSQASPTTSKRPFASSQPSPTSSKRPKTLEKPITLSQPLPVLKPSSPFRRPYTRSLGSAPKIEVVREPTNLKKLTIEVAKPDGAKQTFSSKPPSSKPSSSKPSSSIPSSSAKSTKLSGKEKASQASSIPSSSVKGKGKKHVSGCSSRGARLKPSFSANPNQKQKTPKLISLGLGEFQHHDIEEMCQEPSKYTNEEDDDFWLEAELMVQAEKDANKEKEGEADKEDTNTESDDNDDADWSGDSDESDGGEVDLEEENERRQEFGQETGDVDDEGIVLNKMCRVYKQGQMWKLSEDGRARLKVGDMFNTKQELLMVMKDICILGGFELIKIKSSRSAYTQRCANEGCTWRIHVSHLLDGVTWMVKNIRGEHIDSCGVKDENKMADPKWLCSKLIDYYRMNEDAKVEKMQDEIRSKFGIEVKDHTCYRAKKLMKGMVDGKHVEGYMHLPAYCEEFKARNMGSVCLVNWVNQGPERPPVFRSLVITVGPACISFVNHCRPLIGIDATHLKGPYRGVLLTAMGLDGNNGQFPLAYSVVEKENEEAWTYFLRALTKTLDCEEDQSRYTIMSDRHWGIVNALTKVMPTARRRLCVLHYYKNFANQYPGAWYHDMFYMAANAHADFVYRRVMELIQAKDKGAYDWLVMSELPRLWARCTFDPNLKCEDNTNNFVESFNHAIIKFRGKPCLSMLEDIRKLIGRRFVKRSEMAEKWKGLFVPYVDKKLKQLQLMGRVGKIQHMGKDKFDVQEAPEVNFTVHLKEKYCNCNKWQITGIPCKHATKCILNRKLQIQDYVEPCYSVETYKKLYDHVISPIPSPNMWEPRELPYLAAPHSQIKVGRPPLHRRREPVTHVSNQIEGSATVRCKKCNMFGHNKLTCGRPRDDLGRLVQKRKRIAKLDANGMPKKRGRPSKQPPSKPPSTSNTQLSTSMAAPTNSNAQPSAALGTQQSQTS